MPPKKRTRKEETETMEKPMEHGEDKKEVARQLLKGDGVEKEEAKAVSLLEECVALGDTDAMLMLAECCAFGHGIEEDKVRAETLVSQSAKRGNKEAKAMMRLIKKWKGRIDVDLTCLLNSNEEPIISSSHVLFLKPGVLKTNPVTETLVLPIIIVSGDTLRPVCESIHFSTYLIRYITYGVVYSQENTKKWATSCLPSGELLQIHPEA